MGIGLSVTIIIQGLDPICASRSSRRNGVFMSAY
jgi:hypothetical protein